MTSADVRSPCGEFAKRQGIIHFVFAEPRKLNYRLFWVSTQAVQNMPLSNDRIWYMNT